MNLGDAMAHTVERPRDFLGAMLRPGKEKHRSPVVLEQLFQEPHLVLPAHNEKLMRNPRGRGASGGDFHVDGKFHGAGRHAEDVRRHGGGKEQCLAVRRHGAEDRRNLRGKPHVEHTVRFVKNENPHVVELDAPLLEVVDEPSGCRDNHMRMPREHIFLRLHRRATDEERRAEAKRPADGKNGLFHLPREFARRHDDESPALYLRKALNERDPKRKRLPCPRLCNPDHVFPLNRDGNGFHLNGRGDSEVEFLKNLQDLGRNAKTVEIGGTIGVGFTHWGCRIACATTVAQKTRLGSERSNPKKHLVGDGMADLEPFHAILEAFRMLTGALATR